MYKTLSEKTFGIGGMTVRCRSERTRYGFRHLAEAEGASAKACYYNRTWERFEFQSVLEALARRLPKDQREKVESFCETHQPPNPFRLINAVMSLNSLTAKDEKEANRANSRLLAAGTGIDMPADWDGLPEEEKSRRLKGVAKVMAE